VKRHGREVVSMVASRTMSMVAAKSIYTTQHTSAAVFIRVDLYRCCSNVSSLYFIIRKHHNKLVVVVDLVVLVASSVLDIHSCY
jgi:hypothetical protein